MSTEDASDSRASLALVTGGLGVLALLGFGVAVCIPLLYKAKESTYRERCSSSVRQLAMAASSYASDQRFFPHVRGLRALDGDASTSDGPRAFRLLINFGYLDTPDALICPESNDLAVPTTASEPGLWFWSGKTRPNTARSPLSDGLVDPSLTFTRELSYGWRRRSMNNNAAGTTSIIADRKSSGAHGQGVNLARVDGSVTYVETLDPAVWNALRDPDGDALGLLPAR